jgi:hypothetical protein
MNPTQIFELCKHLNIFRKLEKNETSQWADICSWPSGTALVRLACVACAAHGLAGPALWPSGTVPPGTSRCTRCSCAGARGVAASEARWHRRVAQGKGTWRRPHRQREAAQPSQQLLRRAQGLEFRRGYRQGQAQSRATSARWLDKDKGSRSRSVRVLPKVDDQRYDDT